MELIVSVPLLFFKACTSSSHTCCTLRDIFEFNYTAIFVILAEVAII